MRRRKPARPATEPELGPAVAKVMAEYMGFLDAPHEEDGTDPKAFGARHTAAKTALSHIEQLLKLSGAPEDEAAEKLGACRAMLGDVRQEIGDLPGDEAEEMPSDDDGDPG